MRGWTEMYSDMKLNPTAPMPLYMLDDYWDPWVRAEKRS